MKLFKDKFVSNEFSSKREKVTGDWRAVAWTCGSMYREEKVLMAKYKRFRPLERRRCRSRLAEGLFVSKEGP